MDLQKFRQTPFKRPTADVPVPELKDWLFRDGEEPLLHVRGLEFNEQQLAKNELRKNSVSGALKEAVDKAQAGDTKDLVDVAAKLIAGSLDNKPAPETIYRIELLLRGVIDEAGKPVFSRQDLVRLAQHFPATFERVSDRINDLCGAPSHLGELSNGHGQIAASAMQ
jgi:hypothetical protein